jgi:hypothetical protein
MPFAAAAELVAGAPSSAHPAASDAPQLALPWRQQRRRVAEYDSDHALGFESVGLE